MVCGARPTINTSEDIYQLFLNLLSYFQHQNPMVKTSVNLLVKKWKKKFEKTALLKLMWYSDIYLVWKGRLKEFGAELLPC